MKCFVKTQKPQNVNRKKTKYKKQKLIQQKLLQLDLFLKMEAYITPTMNCFPRSRELGDPDFTRHTLNHAKQYQPSR